MKIEKVSFRNFGSYGNKILSLDMPIDPSFFLVQGKNGDGKCFLPSTEINVLCKAEDLEKFQAFLKLFRSKE